MNTKYLAIAAVGAALAIGQSSSDDGGGNGGNGGNGGDDGTDDPNDGGGGNGGDDGTTDPPDDGGDGGNGGDDGTNTFTIPPEYDGYLSVSGKSYDEPGHYHIEADGSVVPATEMGASLGPQPTPSEDGEKVEVDNIGNEHHFYWYTGMVSWGAGDGVDAVADGVVEYVYGWAVDGATSNEFWSQYDNLELSDWYK